MTTDPSDLWPELGEIACRLATEAGQVAIDMADSARASTSTKSSSVDVVTAADRAAEALIVAGLLAARPDDGILGEEGASHVGPSPVVWHVDPIDGTTNYVYDIPAFSVSIAAEYDGELVAGAVYHPSRDMLYRAVAGQGAWRNDIALTTTSKDDLSTSLVATGFSYLADRRRRQAEVLIDLLPAVRDIRRFGSAALDLCAVAVGEVDAYYERGLNRWDLAAGTLIASEAGAIVENLRGGPPGDDFVLAAGPNLFGPLQTLLTKVDADR